MCVFWGKGKAFSFGSGPVRDLEPRTKVSALQPLEWDTGAPLPRGQERAVGMDPPLGHISPDSSMGSLSTDLRTWSDSPVRELSSILRSLPWMKRPSAGRRSPDGRARDSAGSWVAGEAGTFLNSVTAREGSPLGAAA